MARVRIGWSQVGLLLVLAFGVTCIGFAFWIAKGTDEANRYPAGLVALTPGPGAQTSKQSEVLVDLATGYEGELLIDGVPIPLDQLQYDDQNFGLIYPCRGVSSSRPSADPGATRDGDAPTRPDCSFTPSDNINLPEGQVLLTTVFWKIGERTNTQRSYTWSIRTY
jgi:hypothetical protein